MFVQQYLKGVCALNNFRMFHSYDGMAQPKLEFNISFLMNAEYPLIKRVTRLPAIHIIRNPLDIVQSAYYSHHATHGVDNWPQLEVQRQLLANCSKEEGILLTLAFMERDEMSPRTPGPLHALRHWCFDDPHISTVRMEDLVGDVNSVLGTHLTNSLGRNIRLPPSSEFTFERVSGGRRAGDVDNASHYRTGRPGAWRTELPKPVIAYVQANFRTILERSYPALVGVVRSADEHEVCSADTGRAHLGPLQAMGRRTMTQSNSTAMPSAFWLTTNMSATAKPWWLNSLSAST